MDSSGPTGTMRVSSGLSVMRLFVLPIGLFLFFIVLNSTGIKTWAIKKAPLHSSTLESGTPLGKQGSITKGINTSSERLARVLTYRKIVFIIAYMRTGSSFTGSTLQEHPGTFYLFEPIRSVYDRFLHTKTNGTVQLTYPNGTIRYHTKTDREVVQLAEVKNWVTCNLGDQSMMSLTDKFHKRKTKIISEHACADEFWDKCFQTMIEKCQNAPMMVLKFIRLPMSVLKHLMPVLPNLKVIHLNRDPRGVFNSKSHLKASNRLSTNDAIHQHCKHWADDLKVASELSNLYAGRIISVQYEKLAERPDETFKQICEFIEIPYGKEMYRYIRSMTAADRDGCSFCKQRKNSTETASKWRNEMDFPRAKFIYDACSTGNRIMGYRPFYNGHDMRNQSVPFHLYSESLRVVNSNQTTLRVF